MPDRNPDQNPDQSQGQVALDILYPSGFYSYQTPVLLDYVAAINGIAPPMAPGGDFTYLDLGCGDGFTIILLAAAYPRCRFVGVDFNPGHIAIGRALARAGGLDNVRLIEGGFEDWRSLDLPDCDYVAMHGVYAWISEAARAAVLALVAARLKPGGLLYVSYNANPGWASVAPLRQFFLDYTADMDGDPVANIAATLRHLRELRAKGAAYFVQNPRAAGILEDMANRDIRYVAHEIYAPHWSPLPFSAVSRQMRGAGLSFAGSADLTHNYARPSVKPEFLPMFLKESDRERAELHRDYVNNTFFRRDVFVKQLQATPRCDVVRLLEAFPLGSRVPLHELRRAVPLLDGEMPLTGEPFESLRRTLAAGTMRLAGLRGLAPFRSLPAEALGSALQLLMTGGQITPFAREVAPGPAPAAWTVPLALNRRLLADPVGNDPFLLLISPALGSAVPLPRGDALVLLAVAEAGADGAAAWAWRHAEARKAWLRVKGVAVTEESAHHAAFAQIRDALAPRLGKFVELELIAPH